MTMNTERAMSENLSIGYIQIKLELSRSRLRQKVTEGQENVFSRDIDSG